MSIWPLVVTFLGCAFGYGCSRAVRSVETRGLRFGVAIALCVPFGMLVVMACRDHPSARTSPGAENERRIREAQDRLGLLIAREIERNGSRQ